MGNHPSALRKIRAYVVLCYYRYITRITRLERLNMLPINSTLEDAIEMYGEPNETNEGEEDKEVTVYTFDLFFHEVYVRVRNGLVFGVTYSTGSDDASPRRDLEAVLKSYGEGIGWQDMTPGYSKVRNDGRRRVNMSAVPIIGVEVVDYPGYRENSKDT